MLGGDLAVGLAEVQRDAVVGLDDVERPEDGGWWQAENPGEERRRPLLVAARDDGVVQLHAHTGDSPRFAALRTVESSRRTAGTWHAAAMREQPARLARGGAPLPSSLRSGHEDRLRPLVGRLARHRERRLVSTGG